MEGDAKARAALIAKIAAVIKEVGAVPKSGKNEHFGYAYRRHEDITNKLQPALGSHGIVIIPREKKMLQAEPGYILMEATFDITDGEGTISFVGIGEGADKSRDGRPGDKAAYKAQTGAMKYALNDLLMLAGQDPEEDQKTHGDDKQGAAKKPETPAAPAAGKKPPTAPPAAIAPKFQITDQQRSTMYDLMDAMGYSPRLKELGIQKAMVEGPTVAISALEAKHKTFKEKQAAAPAAGTKGGPAK